MPASHGPPGEWLSVGVEVRGLRKDGTYETATVLSVEGDREVILAAWRDGDLGELGWDKLWREDPVHPARQSWSGPGWRDESQNRLYMDAQALTANYEVARRVDRQYRRRARAELDTMEPYTEEQAKVNFALSLPDGVYQDVLEEGMDEDGGAASTASSSTEPLLPIRQVVRCSCGWNPIVSPMMVACGVCGCLSHCICAGLRAPEAVGQGACSAAEAEELPSFICVFCERGWPRPTGVLEFPPLAPDGIPYQVPLAVVLQRLVEGPPHPRPEVYDTMRARVKERLAARGYEIQEYLGGQHGELATNGQDLLEGVQDACVTAVKESYLARGYPRTAFHSARFDPTARLTLVREAAGGGVVAALMSTAMDQRHLQILGDMQEQLRTALEDPDAGRHLKIGPRNQRGLEALAAVESFVSAPLLSLVATVGEHRRQGLASLMMLHDHAAWAAAGRSLMHLSMTLNRVEWKNRGRNTGAYCYSTSSLPLYEGFGYSILFPRKLCQSSSHIPANLRNVERCRWTTKEIEAGVPMVNCNLGRALLEAYHRVFPASPLLPVDAGTEGSGDAEDEEWEEWEEVEDWEEMQEAPDDDDDDFDPANYVLETQAEDACPIAVHVRLVQPAVDRSPTPSLE